MAEDIHIAWQLPGEGEGHISLSYFCSWVFSMGMRGRGSQGNLERGLRAVSSPVPEVPPSAATENIFSEEPK